MVLYVPLWEKIRVACCFFLQTVLFPRASPGPIRMLIVTFRVASNDPSVLLKVWDKEVNLSRSSFSFNVDM